MPSPLRFTLGLFAAAICPCSHALAATFTVTTTANSGAGSLHQAILDANASPGADVIGFDIATASKTITPPSSAALPTITEALTIDGTTQPGFAGVPLIELNGSSGPALSNGLTIAASDCVIRGLVINRWKGDGIEIQGGANNVIEGCFLGVSLNGASDQGNTLSGVFLSGSASNRIGGTTAAQRNVISGNEDHGVRIEGAASTGNVVQGNVIGLNAAGAAALRNTDHGVSVEGAVNTTVGGAAEGAGNVISGNGARGVSVTGGAAGTVIAGNLIGLNPAGETDLGNSQDGVHVAGAEGTVIGGSTAADRNVISGNNSDGLELNGATTTGTVIQGNFIGLRSSGTASLNNSTHGVFVNGAVNTTVGGATAGLGNVISGNSQHGIAVTGATTAGTLIQGNLIGLDAGGTTDLGNTQDGINVNAVAGTVIGGTAAGAGNRIAGNNGDGLEITGAATQNTVIEGNTIGRDGAPNGGAGILISSAATKNRVGGVAAGQANTLAFNTGDGVFSNGGPENTVRGNSIHSNGGLGIDLGGNGIQSNDATDNDTGANLLQNYPVLTEAVLRAAATEVKGTLQTTANATLTLDFYGNDAADASGNGEGQTWLGSTEVTTDATGFAAFTVNLAVTAQRFVSATATDAAGNTSEFSVTRRAVTTAAAADFTVTTTDDSGPGSLRQAILDANAALNEGDRIVFNIPGDGPHTIAPVTALPALAAPVTLDGTTQPGATANTLAEGFNASLKVILDGNSAPSSTDGLRVEAPRVTVRGLVFHRWKSEAIEVLATAAATVIEGNVIGLGLDSSDLGQNSHGVLVTGSAGNRIGGPAPAQRNVISGNGNHGIFLNGVGARDNVIQGNFIGTDLAGTARLVNNGDGVHITAGNANRIGGPGTGEGNVIGGNNSEGVELENANATVIQGNRLGIAFNGGEIRNGGSGIQFNNASDTLVGDTVAGAGNVIARNSGRGVTLLNNTSQRNQFRGNSIFANGSLGIDLFNNGRTLNDAGDADTGPNGMQNFPELASAVTEAAATRITGTFNGAADATFTLEFFSSTEADSTGFGEGEQFLGSAEVTTDDAGLASFDLSLPTRAIGRIITATATGAEGTSEFSATLRASSTIPPLTFTVTTAADDGPGSLRQALLDADQVMTGAPHRIVFNIPGDGPHMISPATALPVLTSEPVEIDGFTQPGASANALADGFNAVHRIVLDGTAAPFNANGLRFNTAGNVVRGLVIVNFKDDAVRLDGNGNAVEGCLLGLALDGAARPNFRGVRITGTATDNRVGGTTPAARNVIAGNSVSNVELTSSVGVNQVLGNFVGLLPSGSAAPANTDSFFGTSTGIYVQNSPDNVIGGAEPGAGNVIGGHIGMGIEIRDSAAARNRILGNRIGTDVTGLLAVPNQDGIWVVNGPGTVVGGPGAGEGNRLAFNRGNGVTVSGFSTDKDNPVRGNSITGNGELGINLGFGGVLENDPGDADDGANRHQNFPVLTAATAATGSTTLQGTLNSVASRTYALDFFANVACDASGNGEGDQYLGSATVTTEADGNGAFNVTLPVTVVGRFLTATATDPDGNTSEFCDCFEAATEFGSETFLVTNTNDSGDGSLRDALLRNNASVAGSANRLEFAIPGDGPHVITPASSLPAITHAVIMDGYSQPGAQANTLADGGDAVLKIHLQAGQGFAGVGLELNTTGSLVRGLALTKWFTAILVNGAQNTVQGCYLGLDPAGDNTGTLNSIALNLASGSGHRVGGTAPSERNLISGNGTALQVSGSDAVIEGNWFGLDPSGRLPRGNSQPIQLGGANHRFGGDTAGARNVVAATAADGIRLAAANNCLVAGNFIGTDATGLVERGNQGVGLVVTGGSAGNQILGNVIGGSSGAGLQAFGDTVILGNRIGESLDATTPLPNGFGVFLNGSGNRLGGVAAGEGNVIANNRGDGVLLTGTDAVANPVRGNVITDNLGLGINLGFDGVTANDAGDADTGPNGFQNFPELTAGTVHGSTVDVAGTLDSVASAAFTLDFYANREADASGFGEGRQYLGSTTVNTGADGRAMFNVSFNVVALGRWLSATATDAADNTSEFSLALRADTTRPGETFTVTSAEDSGPGTLRQALLDASDVMAGTPHLIRFDIPAPMAPAVVRHVTLPPGVRTIALKSPLPVADEAVAIDGFTQPGTASNTAEDRDDALRLIHLDGAGLPFAIPGLRFHRAGSSVRGLIITAANGPAVELVGEGGHVVTGCLLAGNQDGVVIRGSSGNRIGGTGRGDRNVIIENQAVGVLITGENPKENVVLGNFVGGENGAFNADGVRVESGAANRIGGLAPGEANWIAFNRLAGVFLPGGEDTMVRGNRIFANEGLGLALGARSVTMNDAGDTDTGANGLQNFPVVTAANVVAGGVKVTGTLNAAPNTAYDLDFYHSASCDASGHGEGARHFGTLAVTTDAAGDAAFDAVLAAVIPRGSVTATATGPQGTSEFGQCRVLGTELPAETFLVTTTADAGPGSLRQAILDANVAFTAARNTIAFNLPGEGVQMIQPLSPLPDITQAVDVEGFTQPGAAPATPEEKLNHKILVRLDGEKAGAGTDGLTVAGSGVRVRGLMLTRFAGRGLRVKPQGNASLQESWVGTAGTTAASPNGGLARQALPNPSGSGNGGGVYVQMGEIMISGSVISHNPVGVDLNGSAGTIHNSRLGPGLDDDPLFGDAGKGANVVNSTLVLEGSEIIGHSVGVDLTGNLTRNSNVTGNTFGAGAGADPTPMPNGLDVLIGDGAVGNRIGGPSPAERNVFCSPNSIRAERGGNDVLFNEFLVTAPPDLGAAGPGGTPSGTPGFSDINTSGGDDLIQVNFTGQGEPNVPVVVFPFTTKATSKGLAFVPEEPSEPITPGDDGSFLGEVTIPLGNGLAGVALGNPFGDFSEITPVVPMTQTVDVQVSKTGPTQGLAGEILDFVVTLEATGPLTGPINVQALETPTENLILVFGQVLRGKAKISPERGADGRIRFAYLTATLSPQEPVARFRFRGRLEGTGFTVAKNRVELNAAALLTGTTFNDPNSGNNGAEVTVNIGTSSDPADFGDAPDTYGTTRASDGARHRESATVIGPSFGILPDYETDGFPTLQANGDGADEEGITFGQPLIIGRSVNIGVLNPDSGAFVSAWLDFNRDGDFTDPGEQFTKDVPSQNLSSLPVAVPPNAVPGPTYARFRISTQAGLGPIGEAPDGEVEDYAVEIRNPEPTTIKFGGVPAQVTGADADSIPGGAEITGAGNGQVAFVIDLPDGALGPNAITVIPGDSVPGAVTVRVTPFDGALQEFSLQNTGDWSNEAQPVGEQQIVWVRFFGDGNVLGSLQTGPGDDETVPYAFNTAPGAGLTFAPAVDVGQFGIGSVVQSHNLDRQPVPFSVTVDGTTIEGVFTIFTTILGTPTPTPQPIRSFSVQGLDSFLAFPSTFLNGVNVAAGDVNGDGRDDLSVVGGPGGGTTVAWNGALRVQPAFPGFSSFTGAGPVAGDFDAGGVNDFAINGGFSVRNPLTTPVTVIDSAGQVTTYPAGTAAGNTLVPGGGDREFGFGQTATGDQGIYFNGSTVSYPVSNPDQPAVFRTTDGGATWTIINNRPFPPFVPQIGSVNPLVVGEGDTIQVTGSGFDPNPDNLCLVIMLPNNQAVPIYVTVSTSTMIMGTVGPVPPNQPLGVLGLANGVGGVFPVSGMTAVRAWTSFDVNDVMGPEVGLRPSPDAERQIREFFDLVDGKFLGDLTLSGVFVGGSVVRQAAPGTVTVPAGTVAGIIARAHDHTRGQGHDLAPFEVVFDTPVSLDEFATRICRALEDTFRQAAGLLINCTATITPPNRVDFTVSMADGRIDWGNLILIVRLPAGELTLTARREGGSLVLEWDDAAAVLERAATLNGAFAPVPNATSPHPVPLDAAEGYFRLVRP